MRSRPPADDATASAAADRPRACATTWLWHFFGQGGCPGPWLFFFSSARCMGEGSATLAGFVLALRALVVGQAAKRSRTAKALYLSVLGSLGCGNKQSTYWKSSHHCDTHSGTERHATAFALLCVMLYHKVSNDPYHTKSSWQWHACSHV